MGEERRQPLMGTAYLTPIPPKVYTATTDDVAAVYAVHPLAIYQKQHTTAFVVVASSQLVNDTVVYPCDCTGEMLALELLACVPIQNHRQALRAAGWDLEVVIPRVG